MAEERKFHSKLREGLMFICKSLIFFYKNSISQQYKHFYFEMIQKLAYYVVRCSFRCVNNPNLPTGGQRWTGKR